VTVRERVIPSEAAREDGSFVNEVRIKLFLPPSSLWRVECRVREFHAGRLMRTAASIPVTCSASQ
jgi:hypothetical protein